MARRLEWQQISTQGLNPADSFRNYYQGLQQAAQITDGLRGRQLQADESIMKGHDRVIQNSLAIDQNDFSKQQHADRMDLEREKMASAERRAAMQAAGKGAGSTDFDRGVVGQMVRDHLDNGGTLDNAGEIETLAAVMQSKAGYDFVTNEANRYDTGYKNFIESQTASLAAARDDRIAKLTADFQAADGSIDQDVFDREIANVHNDYALAVQGLNVNGRNLYAQDRRNRTSRVGGPSSSTVGSSRQNLEYAVGTTQDNINNNRARLTETKDPQEQKQLAAQIQQDEEYLVNLEESSVFKNKDGYDWFLDYSQDEKGNLTLSNGATIPARHATLINDAAINHDVPFGLIAAVLKPSVENMVNEGYASDEDIEASFNFYADTIAEALKLSLDSQGSNATLERAYADVITQGNDLSKVFNLSNDRNTPINELMKAQGFSPNAINYFEQSHKDAVPFKDKNGKWLTINQWENSIPDALGFSPLNPAADVDPDVLRPRDTPASDMEDRVQELKLAGNNTPENIQNVAKQVGKDTVDELDSFIYRDNGIPDMDAANMLVSDLVGAFAMRPPGSGRPLSKLTKDEFESLTGGVKFNNDKQAYELYTELINDPVIGKMREEDLAVVLSFAVKGNYFNNFDPVSTKRNIAELRGMWENQNENYKAVKANIVGLRDNWGKMTEAFDKAAVIRDKVEASNIGMKVIPNFDKNSPLAQEQIRANHAELQKALNIEQAAIERYYPAVRANAEQLATTQAARAGTFENRSRLAAEAKVDTMEEKNFIRQFSERYHPSGRIHTNTTPAGVARQMLPPEERHKFDAKKYTAEQNARIEAGRAEAKRIYELAKKHNIPTGMLAEVYTTKHFENILKTLGIRD